MSNLYIISPKFDNITKVHDFKILNNSLDKNIDIQIGRLSGYFVNLNNEIGILHYNGKEYYAVITDLDQIDLEMAKGILV
jgi:hypothetical protein